MYSSGPKSVIIAPTMTPDQYCAAKTRASGSSFTFSFRFLAKPQQRAMNALYAFCRELDDIVDETDDREHAREQLNHWRMEIDRLYRGTPQHPITQALQPLLAQFDLSEDHFLEFIDGMEMDLEQNRYADFSELSLYCYRVASVVGLLSAEIFGYQNRHTLKYAHELGLAFQTTNILRDVREDLQRNRLYIPLDEMAQVGVSEEELRRGEMTPSVRALLQLQADRSRCHYQKAFELLPEEDRYRQRSGVIMASVYLTLLDTIERNDFPVLQRRVRLPAWKKIWLALRTAHGERLRHQRFLQRYGG